MRDAAGNVLAARSMHPGNTLADLYDATAMPNNLRAAHSKLDGIAAGCFGIAKDASDEEILEVLFDAFTKLVAK
jgi:hypothetical protein